MVLPAGKVYVPRNAAEIRRQYLDDIELGALEQGIEAPPIEPDTDNYIRATATANVAMLLFAAVSQHDSARRATDADLDELQALRVEYGLPEVQPSRSSGQVVVRVTGSATMPLGTQAVLPNGLRIATSETKIVTNGSTINVSSIDSGTATNAVGGTVVRWANPPNNVFTEATVSDGDPLTGGLDEEDESRLRTRILNSLRNRIGGGNWAQIAQWALDANPVIQYPFVYPALGGPGSFKVALMRRADVENGVFERAVPIEVVNDVYAAIESQVGDHVEFVVQSVVDVSADASVRVTLPDSEVNGGDGRGWTDSDPWPQLESTDNGRVIVSGVFSTTSIQVSAFTSTEPAIGTSIAWWSKTERRFYVTTIASVSGGSGAWVLGVDDPLTDALSGSVAIGDYISPASTNIEQYGETWRDALNENGPGENTADPNRLPVALRRPRPGEGSDDVGAFPMGLGTDQLCLLKEPYQEMTDLEWSYRSVTTATAPPLVAGAPEILTPRHFGIYKK